MRLPPDATARPACGSCAFGSCGCRGCACGSCAWARANAAANFPCCRRCCASSSCLPPLLLVAAKPLWCWGSRGCHCRRATPCRWVSQPGAWLAHRGCCSAAAGGFCQWLLPVLLLGVCVAWHSAAPCQLGHPCSSAQLSTVPLRCPCCAAVIDIDVRWAGQPDVVMQLSGIPGAAVAVRTCQVCEPVWRDRELESGLLPPLPPPFGIACGQHWVCCR